MCAVSPNAPRARRGQAVDMAATVPLICNLAASNCFLRSKTFMDHNGSRTVLVARSVGFWQLRAASLQLAWRLGHDALRKSHRGH